MGTTQRGFRVFLLASALFAGILAGPASAGHDLGETAYSAGDFDTAAREFQSLAQAGDAVGQYYLGLLYEEGQGLPQDYEQAVHWYKKAVAQGNVDASYALGQLFSKGKHVPRDLTRAYLWFDLAANAPHPHRLAKEARARVAKQMNAEETARAASLQGLWQKYQESFRPVGSAEASRPPVR